MGGAGNCPFQPSENESYSSILLLFYLYFNCLVPPFPLRAEVRGGGACSSIQFTSFFETSFHGNASDDI